MLIPVHLPEHSQNANNSDPAIPLRSRDPYLQQQQQPPSPKQINIFKPFFARWHQRWNQSTKAIKDVGKQGCVGRERSEGLDQERAALCPGPARGR